MLFVQFIYLTIGFALLIKGADWFVEGASAIASKFGIPQLVIGLTIVAMGTSLPEAAVSITAVIGGNAGITFGNVIGSNIINVLLILGITSLITNIAVQRSTFYIEIPFMLGITVLLLIFGFSGNRITFYEGIVLCLCFFIYLAYLFILTRKGHIEEEEINQIPVVKSCIYILLGSALVIFGSDACVDSATFLARALGLSERVIGLTIVAFGTSLPELVTSAVAAKKGNAGIAIGNIVGSNIFNILFVIGITTMISDVAFQKEFTIDCFVAIASGVMLWACAFKNKALNKRAGAFMLFGYGIYFSWLMWFK